MCSHSLFGPNENHDDYIEICNQMWVALGSVGLSSSQAVDGVGLQLGRGYLEIWFGKMLAMFVCTDTPMLAFCSV